MLWNSQSVFIFDSQVACDLRRHHRIIGTSTGTAVGFIQQNSELGLPLQLSQFEAALAEEEGWITVAADKEAETTVDVAAGGEKTESASAAAQVVTDPVPSESEGSEGPSEAECDSDSEYCQPEWLAIIRSGLPYELPVQIPECSSAIRGPLMANSKANHPDHNARELRRHLVFRDLHRRGFCVTGGHKFGGDFLAYEGDPCLFHARYSVRVLHDTTAHCKPLAAAANRGAHGAKKRYLLALVQDEAMAAAMAGNIGAAAALPINYRAVVQVLGGAVSGDIALEPFDIMTWPALDNLSKLCQDAVQFPAWALEDAP